MRGKYTLQEIKRMPELLKLAKNFNLSFEKSKKYTFIGCGSSYNLGYITVEMLKKYEYNAEIISGGNVITFNKTLKLILQFFYREQEKLPKLLNPLRFLKRKI